MIKSVISLAGFVPLVAAGPNGKCRVLAMRGGGIHGSFEVGVLKAFTDTLAPEEYQYDIVSGVSVGALNTAMFAIHKPGYEKEAVAFLENFYKKSLPQDYWDFWPTYVLEPFFKTSFVDPTKLRQQLHELIAGKPIYRKISI